MTTHSDSQSQKLFNDVQVGRDINVVGNITLNQTVNNKVANLLEQDDEISHRNLLLDYRFKSEEFIYASYARSECIDLRCEETLKELRETLGLLPEQTISIENEIIQNYFDTKQQLENKVHRYQHQIIGATQDKSFLSDEDRELIEERQKAIEIENQPAASALSLLGIEFIREGKLEKASAYFKESIRLNGHDPSAYVGLGTILCKQGDVKEALDILNMAETLYQLNPKLKKQNNEFETIITRIKDISKKKRQNIFANFLESFCCNIL